MKASHMLRRKHGVLVNSANSCRCCRASGALVVMPQPCSSACLLTTL